jgi:enoyl-CoA hydratase/carnithine racemase
MPAEPVLVDRRGTALVITLNRPERRNAITPAMIGTLIGAVDVLEADGRLRAGIITGTGRAFCAGADLAPRDAGPDEHRYVLREYMTKARSKPIIAAVNGAAVGGGFELVLDCDLVVAADTARFCLPEGRRGRIPAGGAVLRLPELLPRKRATELLVTGDWLSCAEAHTYGLVNRVVPAGTECDSALSLAEEITRSAPLAVAALTAMLRAEHQTTWDEVSQAAARLKGSADAAEGAAAFLAKREPDWSGS